MKKQKSPTDGAPKTALPKWVIFLVIIVLLLLSPVVHKAWQKSRVAAKLQGYRDAGLPTTAAELETWRPPPPPEQNAAVKLSEAAELIGPWKEKRFLPDFEWLLFYRIRVPQFKIVPEFSLKSFEWNRLFYWPREGEITQIRGPRADESIDEETREILTGYLNDNQEVIERLHEAVKCETFRYIDYTQDIETQAKKLMRLMSHVGTFCNLLFMETLIYREEQSERAVQSVISSFRLAEVLFQEPFFDSYRRGGRVTNMAVVNLEYTLNRCSLTGEQIQEMAAVIAELESGARLYPTLIGERSMMTDREVYSRVRPISILQDKSSLIRDLFGKNFKKTMDKWTSWLPSLGDMVGVPEMDNVVYLEFTDRYLAVLELPVGQRHRAVRKLDNEVIILNPKYSISKSFLPLMSSLIKLDTDHLARLHLAQGALLVEQYRLDHNGQLPADLQDLTPDYVETLPVDPFNYGRAIKYKQIEGGYIVYSIDDDEIDHGGRSKDDPPDYTFDNLGTDMVFTVKRK